MMRVTLRGVLLGLWLLSVVGGAGSAWPAPVPVLNPSGEIAGGVVYTLINGQTVNATATVASSLVDQMRGGYFGLWYTCASVIGTAEVSLAWHESPTTESADFVSTNTVDATIGDVTRIRTVAPPPMRYGRAVLVGGGTNPADTVCTVKLFGTGW